MSLCMGCMQELNGSVICPNCHFDNSEVQSAPFLPFGTELAGRYVTGTGLETNGESTRYIAFDKQTEPHQFYYPELQEVHASEHQD